MKSPADNRYIEAIQRHLVRVSSASQPLVPDIFLENMIQGRILQYIAQDICEHHHLEKVRVENKMVRVLTVIFSKSFFKTFREKVKESPNIVYRIAKLIARTEIPDQTTTHEQIDGFYRNILKKYFASDLIKIRETVESDPEVQDLFASVAYAAAPLNPPIQPPPIPDFLP